MNIVVSWIEEILGGTALSAAQMAEALTARGLEVEALAYTRERARALRVATVQSAEMHEGKRWLTLSHSGGRNQVVCGDDTVQIGETVAFAPVGTTLWSGEVEAKNFGGRISDGLLVSQFEAGLGGDASRVWRLPPGAEPASLVADDAVISLSVTPNRGDALSHLGVAREIESGLVLKRSSVTPPQRARLGSAALPVDSLPTTPSSVAVQLNSTACGAYALADLTMGTVDAEAYARMQYRLGLCGQRSISPIVDLTNYVLFECGQPSHAFERAALQTVEIRQARAGESIATLEGGTHKLTADDCIIACNGAPGAIAGVIGGTASSSQATSRNLALEVAWFDPIAVRKTRTRLGLNSDSSYRFEREVDPALAEPALGRLLHLARTVLGATLGGATLLRTHKPKSAIVPFEPTAANTFLGTDFSAAQMHDVLTSLGCYVASTTSPWSVTAPSWRPDIAITPDLWEEIARVMGYDRVPDLAPAPSFQPAPQAFPLAYRIADALVAQGFLEAITYDFYAAKDDAIYSGEPAIGLKNPLSADFERMRRGLLPGLLQCAAYNLNRQAADVQMFEHGVAFRQCNGVPVEEEEVAFVAAPARESSEWHSTVQPKDRLWLGAVQAIQNTLAAMHLSATARLGSTAHYAEGALECLEFVAGDAVVARLLHVPAAILKRYDIRARVYFGQFLLPALRTQLVSVRLQSAEPARYPSVRRDLALLVPQAQPAGAVVAAARQSLSAQCIALSVFDHYAGERVEKGYYNLGLRFVFRDQERSLTADEVDAAVATVYRDLSTALGVKLREGSIL